MKETTNNNVIGEEFNKLLDEVNETLGTNIELRFKTIEEFEKFLDSHDTLVL